MSTDVIYVLVAVRGVEDETAAHKAIDNLTNAEQSFDSIQTKTMRCEAVEALGDPVIYFP